ncbi:hypothetical protein TraAM80_05402 [Trypanosoma rangeli]|uniref:Uncharacterized protein n=1 Tax=Trypanosoma rangeli TaxID=5698 RepID=A0A3R7NL73_TRYRA|nr:uncharacterized protein TraAM80_05402 [Trypanosoma rangeli]RNF04266.1 hypothetical protein TraAM80_05402 [Trypanosoma rangeli]|eukprot:RNF04266.1 hypothetical protein TraAM80_05402 [Trypanosoma rangeli]
MEDDWNGDGGISNLLLLEEPSALHLPCSVRFRAFSDAVDNSVTREAAWRTVLPNSLCVHKRRRLDDVSGCGGEALVRPILRVMRDPIEVARRRFETLRWFDEPRGAEEIRARFELDRRLGVQPSLAALHQALKRLRTLHHTKLIAELAEELVMDAPAMSVYTLLHIVEGLEGEPQRAASLLFSLAPLVTNGTVPTSVWSSLCCELDTVARQMPAPLERSIVDLFGQLFNQVREDGPVNGSIVVYYGQALLKSRAPIRSVVGFVQTELLSGRNTPPSYGVSELRLSAFISELIQVLSGCPNGGVDEREEGPPFSARERLLCCSDLVKHAYAGRLSLNQAAFDVLLRFCDEEQEYSLLCILFLAMCALSTPTLLSVTRVAEVLCDVEELSCYLAGVLGQPIPRWMLYILVRYGKSTLFSLGNRKNNTREALEMHFCDCLARLCARDGTASLCMDVFDAIVEYGNPAGAHVFVCALARALGMAQRPFVEAATKTDVTALEPFNLETLYYALGPAVVTLGEFRSFIRERPSAFLFPSHKGSGVTLEHALAVLLESPQVYGTVLDATAVCALAESSALAEAFVKMMDGYAAKSGAVAFVPFEVSAATQLTDAGRQLLLAWLTKHNWLILLPLSSTVQLLPSVTSSATSTPVSLQQQSCVLLFHAVRRGGHKKVAFVTAAGPVAEQAKAEGVHPVITLAELKVRLGLH